MTMLRWLRIASAVTALLFLLVIAVAWKSAVDERTKANDIGLRTKAQIERIEAVANRMEREAAAP
jgi:hypothetical protein